MKSPNPQVHTLVFGVQVTWVALVALVLELAALAWYISSTRRCTQRGRYWPATKTTCFVLSVAVVAYTMEGGIAHYERSNFTLDVVRCLLLVNVAPPLFWLGSPLTLAVRASSASRSAALLEALNSRTARLLSHPVFTFTFAMASLYIYFLTPLYGWAQEHPVLGAYMQLHLFIAGALFWWPIVGRDLSPRPLNYVRRFVLVFTSVPLTIALGAAISSLTRPLYPAGNTLLDTQTGGDFFWELGETLTVLVLALLFVSWIYEEERKAKDLDRERDRALAARQAAEPGPETSSETGSEVTAVPASSET